MSRARTYAALTVALIAIALGAVAVALAVPDGESPQPTPAASGPSTPPSVRSRWLPRPGLSWQWQLTTPVDTSIDAAVYDIDGFENGPEVVAALHRAGRRVICYIEAGTAADFRPDYARWPPEVLGHPSDWPGERWLDIRQRDAIARVLAYRFDMCRDKGFDAVEPDILDHYQQETGFPVTAADQLAFNRMVADLAHERGLAVGLKNDVEQVPELLSYFDFAIDEECTAYAECDALTPFVTAGKAVFHVEYDLPLERFCPRTDRLGFSSMRKNRDLDAARWPCRH